MSKSSMFRIAQKQKAVAASGQRVVEKLGTITAYTAGAGTCEVHFDGEDDVEDLDDTVLVIDTYAPVVGDRIWCRKVQSKWIAVSRIGGLPRKRFLIKSGDESLTAQDTNFYSDSHITFQAEANAVYKYDLHIFTDINAAADLKWQWSTPAGSSFHHSVLALSTGATTVEGDVRATRGTGAVVGGASGANNGYMYGSGIIRISNTAGTVTWLRGRNVNPGVVTVTIKADTHCIVERVV